MMCRWWLTAIACLVLLSIVQRCQALYIEVFFNNSQVVKTYKDQNALNKHRSYGMPYDEYIIGTLEYPNPANACSKVDSASSDKIAFVPDYDECPINSTSNIYNAKYGMMLMYSTNGKKLKIRTALSDLPQAVIDNEEFVNFLKNTVLSNNETEFGNYTLRISEDYWYFYKLLLIIFGSLLLSTILLILAICLCVCSFQTIYKKWQRRGLASWRIKQLTRRRYHKGKEITDTCSICLEDFEEKERVRVLPCEHIFHPSCVDEWLRNWNRVCPLCKTSISRNRSSVERQSLLSNLESSTAESSRYGSIRLSSPNLVEVDEFSNSSSEEESISDRGNANAVTRTV